MNLRPNQIEPVRLGIEFFKKKNPVPSIIVAPTAFGKSLVIAFIAKEIEDKILILQPSKELLAQNFAKYIALGGTAEIYSASFGSKRVGSVTYATIGSIKNIGLRFKELGFTKMIIDESHLYPRNSDSMLGGFLADSGITYVLGLTATPLKLQSNRDRSGNAYSTLVMLTSRSKKGQFFKEIIYVSQVSEMVELGFWSKLEYEQYNIDEGKLVYNSTKAEFTEESIQAVYETNNIEAKIIAKINSLSNRKSIIVFVPSVADAKKFAEIVPSSVAIYGDMLSADRDIAIRKFKRGAIRVVFNVNVLSVGFDHPELDCIICARSTASLSWFYQALGRGTRIAQHKKDCLIVDFSGNVKRFGRVEYLFFRKEKIWKLYGEGGKLLTGCPIHQIGEHTQESESKREIDKENKKIEDAKIVMPFGKFKGTEIKDLNRGYREWMLANFSWSERNYNIKKEILRLKSVQV